LHQDTVLHCCECESVPAIYLTACFVQEGGQDPLTLCRVRRLQQKVGVKEALLQDLFHPVHILIPEPCEQLYPHGQMSLTDCTMFQVWNRSCFKTSFIPSISSSRNLVKSCTTGRNAFNACTMLKHADISSQPCAHVLWTREGREFCVDFDAFVCTHTFL
jgi:hypothetical protein